MRYMQPYDLQKRNGFCKRESNGGLIMPIQRKKEGYKRKLVFFCLLFFFISGCYEYYRAPSRSYYPGSSVERETCFCCDGTGRTECSRCNGTGVGFDCVSCNGTGVVSCRSCGGTGYSFLGGKCFSCNGTGLQKCFLCGGRGYNPCISCNGRGTVKCICCNGKGYK